MAHLVGRVTALNVAKAKKPVRMADGAGLNLRVSGDGESQPAKSWIFRSPFAAAPAKWASVPSRSAGRMKASKEHRVPLSAAALAIAETLRNAQGGVHLFPGGKRDRPLSNMAMLALLDRMGRSDLTAHCFRSTFRD